MSSSSSALAFIGQQASIYMGIPILIVGVLGGFLNTIVFLSLKTFRENSCAFYLTIMSITNIGQLIFGLFSRVMISGFLIDWTQSSLFYCKFRAYLVQVCVLISLSCYCIATIDQYFATCSHPRLQQWCNIKIAQRLCTIIIIVSFIYGTPYLIYYDLIQSVNTNKSNCILTNPIFSRYFDFFSQPVLVSSLPLFITILFGFMAYNNVRQLSYRAVPLIRRELDRQLTKMVLFQVIINIFCISPYFIVTIIPTSDGTNIRTSVEVVNIFTTLFYYIYYANPFFIYICTSERFRRQLIYVLFEIYLKRWQQPNIAINQIEPQT